MSLFVGAAFGQVDYIFKRGNEAHNFTLSDSLWLDTAGTDTGDTLTFDFYIYPFAAKCKFNATLTRSTGSYTKTKAYFYTAVVYNSGDTGWTLTDSLTFAGTTTAYTLISSVNTVYTQYGRIKFAPSDSLQTHSVRAGVLIESN